MFSFHFPACTEKRTRTSPGYSEPVRVRSPSFSAAAKIAASIFLAISQACFADASALEMSRTHCSSSLISASFSFIVGILPRRGPRDPRFRASILPRLGTYGLSSVLARPVDWNDSRLGRVEFGNTAEERERVTPHTDLKDHRAAFFRARWFRLRGSWKRNNCFRHECGMYLCVPPFGRWGLYTPWRLTPGPDQRHECEPDSSQWNWKPNMFGCANRRG